jgi:hypothetical protein
VVRPLASQWRAKVLRQNPRRDAAKRLAIAAAGPHLPAEFVDDPDVSEAWCMARWAWGWWMTHKREAA